LSSISVGGGVVWDASSPAGSFPGKDASPAFDRGLRARPPTFGLESIHNGLDNGCGGDKDGAVSLCPADIVAIHLARFARAALH
jgi:hypothetical protein